MEYEYNHPRDTSNEDCDFEVHKLSTKQRRLFGELQEADVKFQATIKMLEKAQVEANFAFSTFWGAINKDHQLHGRRAVIDQEHMEVWLSK